MYGKKGGMDKKGGKMCGAMHKITPNEKMVTSKASMKNFPKGSEGKKNGAGNY